MSIVCTELSFSWPDGSVVLDRLNAAFGPGRTGLIGVNGSGKSTLLRLIAGLRDDAQIRIELPGTEVPAGRTVLTVTGLDGAWHPARALRRAAFECGAGAGDAGKTTLLRALTGHAALAGVAARRHGASAAAAVARRADEQP